MHTYIKPDIYTGFSNELLTKCLTEIFNIKKAPNLYSMLQHVMCFGIVDDRADDSHNLCSCELSLDKQEYGSLSKVCAHTATHLATSLS